MKQYSTFTFDSYGFDRKTGTISLTYGLSGEITFTEVLKLPTEGMKEVKKDTLNRALEALHLIGGMSYYKTCCPKKIEVKSASLSEKQAQFWNTVYENGLGEFFYKNDIDFRGLISFPATKEEDTILPQSDEDVQPSYLIPMGGGKDSLVTVELLKPLKCPMTLLRVNSHPLIDACVKKTKLPCITVERIIDSQLMELNEQGALNGHVSITAYISFLSIVIAELYGMNEVAMSNESSASEGNTEFYGKKINHQWSKSEECERMIRKYSKHYIDPYIHYSSHLREMNELQIVQQFIRHPEYFPCVTSCNKNWKIAGEKPKERWCGECPKCAFAFVLFAAFLGKKQLMEVFGKNLFENDKLIPLYKELLGIEGIKPFECVGTPRETSDAFARAKMMGDLEGTPVMNMYTEHFPEDE